MEKTISTEWEGGELFGVEIDLEVELVCAFQPPTADTYTEPGDGGEIDLQAVLVWTKSWEGSLKEKKQVNIMPILPPDALVKLEDKCYEALMEEVPYDGEGYDD